MRIGIILLSVLFLCSCKKEKKVTITPVNSILEKDSTKISTDIKSVKLNNNNFTKPPINIKELILDESKYDVTSSSIDKKYLKENCDVIKYRLLRSYNVIPKQKEFIINRLNVYVKEDKFEWNREKANETLESLIVKENSIKLWSSLFVGMKVNDLLEKIALEEYHKDKEVIKLYSKVYDSKFYFDINNTITKMEVKRRCNNISK